MYKFKCKNCGGNQACEVLINVTYKTVISEIEDNRITFEWDLDEHNTDEIEDIARFECRECKSPVLNQHGSIITEIKEFTDYCKGLKQ